MLLDWLLRTKYLRHKILKLTNTVIKIYPGKLEFNLETRSTSCLPNMLTYVSTD